jgi:hypothetical protein
MANPSLTQLNVPGLVAPETRVFRAIQSVLVADPTLQSVELKIRAWEGDVAADGRPADLVEADLVEADLPLLKLAPAANPAKWEGKGQYKGTFKVDMTLYTLGSHADDAMNTWHAIRTALYPEDEGRAAAVDALLKPIGVFLPRPDFDRQPATIVPIAGGLFAIKSVGTITAQVGFREVS